MDSNHWQLFLDDVILARSTGFDRVLHHPRPLGVVIPSDQPWETAGAPPAFVARREDGSFVAHYMAMWWDIDASAALPDNFRQDRAHNMFQAVAYATSEDGLHWVKPNLGLVDAPAGVDWQKHAPYPSPQGRTRENNLGVPYVVVADLGRFGNVQRPRRSATRCASRRGRTREWARRGRRSRRDTSPPSCPTSSTIPTGARSSCPSRASSTRGAASCTSGMTCTRSGSPWTRA